MKIITKSRETLGCREWTQQRAGAVRVLTTIVRGAALSLATVCPLAAQPPPDEPADLAAFVHGALAAAPTNFSDVRGMRIDENRFGSTANFGPSFTRCSVIDDTAGAIFNGATGAWELDCVSEAHDLTLGALDDLVRKAITASLPPTFVLRVLPVPKNPDRTYLDWKGPDGMRFDATFDSDAAGKTFYRIRAEREVGSPSP